MQIIMMNPPNSVLFEVLKYESVSFKASHDAIEVMWVTESALANLTDVTLVSDDTF